MSNNNSESLRVLAIMLILVVIAASNPHYWVHSLLV
jgi:hypothetical protein